MKFLLDLGILNLFAKASWFPLKWLKVTEYQLMDPRSYDLSSDIIYSYDLYHREYLSYIIISNSTYCGVDN
jgi:hypothetical protein